MAQGSAGGPGVKNPPANAGGSHIPRSNEAHVPQLLRPHALEPMTCNKEKPPQWEACAPQLKSSPRLLQLEKAFVQHQRPSTTKNK